MKQFFRIFNLSIALMFITFTVNVMAQNNVLDRIDVQDSRDQSVVKVYFSQRLLYQSHAPKKQGDLIHVSVNFQGEPAAVKFVDEFLSWKPTPAIPLFEVKLEWRTTTQADLIFRFNQSVRFTLQPSSDSYSLTLTIFHPRHEQAKTIPLPALDDTIKPLPKFQQTAENKVLAKIMEEARQAIAKKDYPAAIKLYTKVLGAPHSVFSKQALEYLAVAREKNRQFAHAKKLYEQYLKRYPKGEDAQRVRQRLLALISASKSPKNKLHEATTKIVQKETPQWQYYGGFSQFYNRFISFPDAGGNQVSQSDLRSDLDLTARRRTQDLDLTARFTGGYTADFLPNKPNDDRISSLYIDAKDKLHGLFLRLGRQTRTTGGVLGRFDGVLGNYQLNDTIKLNLVFGSPVDSASDVKLVTERYFYGISTDIGTLNNAWDFNLFAINQRNDGFTDRRAIGGEMRYFDPVKSFFTLIDYDVFYHDLNLLLFNGRWQLTEKTMATLSYEYRNSPILTTRNALTGQTTASHLQQLLHIFPKNTVYQLAQDRTSHSNMWQFALTHRLNSHFQLDGTVRLTKFSGTVASGGVPATQGTDLEKEYSFQLTGSNLLKEGDLLLSTATYSDLTTSQVTTLLLSARYPINAKLRINPKFRFRHRNNQTNSSTQNVYTTSLQIIYRIRRNLQFETEFSMEWDQTHSATQSLLDKNYFILVGYRYDF